MSTETMGKVLVAATIENLSDVLDVEKGRLTPDQVRRIEVGDALVDTGATSLCMPRRLVEQIGLTPLRTRSARTSAGVVQVQVYGTARLTVQGRECRIDVTGLPDECPVLIGQVPLGLMDWVVDPGRKRLIGNPEHGGEQMIEIY